MTMKIFSLLLTAMVSASAFAAVPCEQAIDRLSIQSGHNKPVKIEVISQPDASGNLFLKAVYGENDPFGFKSTGFYMSPNCELINTFDIER